MINDHIAELLEKLDLALKENKAKATQLQQDLDALHKENHKLIKLIEHLEESLDDKSDQN